LSSLGARYHYDESVVGTLGAGSTDKAVEVLAELAGAGPVIELGSPHERHQTFVGGCILPIGLTDGLE
jgi:hypothetical protein